MAKTSILTILISLARQGNADKETIKGLSQLRMGVTQAMGAFAAFAGIAYTVDKALNATVGTFVNYASQVREMSRLTGAGAEETSRLIQMADDLTISYESLQKSLWFASKNGVEVNVDSLASLADQYVALNSPMERADFLAKQFGKSGMDMAKMLEQGGAAVRDWAGSIEGSLVLTNRAVQEAREYELALDQLNDQWLAIKVNIGGQVLPVLNDMLFGMNNQTQIQAEANRLIAEGIVVGRENAMAMALQNVKIEEYTNGLDSAGLSYRSWAEAMALGNDQLTAQGETIDQINQRNTDMLSLIMNLQSENESYNESLTTLNDKMAALTLEQSNYLAGSKQYDELQGEIDQTGAAIQNLAAEHEMAGRRIAFSLLQQKLAVDGLEDREFSALLSIGQQWGILDETTVIAANNMTREVNELTASTTTGYHAVNQLQKQWEKAMQLSGQSLDLYVNIHTSGSLAVSKTFQTTKPTQQATALAGGGQWGGGWAIVGEEGYEILSPSGYVFPHEQAKQMIAGGLMPDIQLAGGGSLKLNSLAGEDFTPSTTIPSGGGGSGGGTTVRRRRERGELSGGNNAAVTSAVVSEAVTPLVQTTADAAQSTQAAQQAAAAEMQATRNAIEQGNVLQSELIDEIRRFNATNKQTIMAAFEQSRG